MIWLAIILIVDAVISPGGTGLIYVGTTARISYALGLPNALTRINARGVPVWSIIVATIFGMFFLAPAPSWQQLVGVITGATAVMYALRTDLAGRADATVDPTREHPYRVPAPKVHAARRLRLREPDHLLGRVRRRHGSSRSAC